MLFLVWSVGLSALSYQLRPFPTGTHITWPLLFSSASNSELSCCRAPLLAVEPSPGEPTAGLQCGTSLADGQEVVDTWKRDARERRNNLIARPGGCSAGGPDEKNVHQEYVLLFLASGIQL